VKIVKIGQVDPELGLIFLKGFIF